MSQTTTKMLPKVDPPSTEIQNKIVSPAREE